MAQETNQGASTPALYTLYGKQYNYNDLALEADRGLTAYLSGLRDGNDKGFRDAYANIMSGIKDGSITFDNGRFHDSLGRYTNADKKTRDYYGLMANYIYDKMGKSGEYKAPEDTSKIKWDSGSVKTALMKLLFNSDTGNMQDFLDLDPEEKGKRGVSKRAAYLAAALLNIANNWDATFLGYSDADKATYIPLLNNAAQALLDGTIDPGDYLALSKAVGGMDFRNMFITETKQPTSAGGTAASTATEPTTTLHKLKSTSLMDNSFDLHTLDNMSLVMVKVPTKGLINILRNSFYNRKYTFGSDVRMRRLFKSNNLNSRAGITATLNALQLLGKLKQADPNNPNLYYIPGLRSKYNTGWVWDKSTNTVSEMDLNKIPYAALKLSAGVPSNRKGGILKAATGSTVPFWYDGMGDYDPTKYQTQYGKTSYGIDDKGQYISPYGNNGKGTGEGRYLTDPNYSDYSLKGKDYVTAVEGQQNYKDFTDALIKGANDYVSATDKSTLNDDNNLFVRWAHDLDKSIPTGSTASFFDEKGNLRTSWGSKNQDSYKRGPNLPFTSLTDYITHVRNDQLLGSRHNVYMKEGKRYFYKDKDGVKHWVDPEVANNGTYNVSKNGISTTENGVNWTDYELTGLSKGGSDIDLETQSKVNPDDIKTKALNTLENIAPLLIANRRLADSLRTNNKIADISKLAIHPVLQQTYERYSPVTGAFSEMLLRNRQAADLNRLGSQLYTSDAALNTARQKEANSQANTLLYQGFLADDKEIQRTKGEALARQEDNVARRSQTANANRAAINLAELAIANIEAQRLKANQASRNEYQQGIEEELRTNKAYKDLEKRQEQATNRQLKLQLEDGLFNLPYEVEQHQIEESLRWDMQELYTKYKAALDKFTKEKGEDADYTNEDFYKKYLKDVKELKEKYYNQAIDLATRKSNATIARIDLLRSNMNNSPLFKRGGKFNLSTINLLRKIIN